MKSYIELFPIVDKRVSINSKISTSETKEIKEAASASSQLDSYQNDGNSEEKISSNNKSSEVLARAIHVQEEKLLEERSVISYCQDFQVPLRTKCKNAIYNFVTKRNIVTDVIFPIGITCLVVSDIIRYVQDNGTRFEASFLQVLTGTAFGNPVYGSSTLFNIKMGDTNYWLPLTAIMSASLVEHMVRTLPVPESISNSINQINSCAISIYNKIPSPIKVIGSISGWWHLLKFIYWKNNELLNYFKLKQNCMSNNQAYVYLSNLVDYACTVCGDWNFVYPLFTNSRQKCLDALLKQKLPPDEMQLKLDRLARNKGTISHIDLSKQSWLTLEYKVAKKLFEKLGELVTNRLEKFTYTLPNQIYETNNIQLFADLIKKINPKHIVIENQRIGSQHNQIFAAINQTNVETVTYRNNGIDTNLGINLVASLPTTAEGVVLGDNQINEGIYPNLVEYSRRTNTSRIDLSTNRLSSVAELIRNLYIRHPIDLNIANIPISTDDAKAIAEGLQQGKIRHLGIADCEIDNAKFEIISTGFGSEKLESIDLSDNPFDSEAVQVIDQWPPNLKKLILFNNKKLDEAGHIDMFKRLPKTIEHLAIGDQTLTKTAISSIIQLVRRTMLNILEIPNTGLDKEGMKELNDHWPQESYLMLLVISRNPYPQESFNKLVEQMKRKPVGLIAEDNLDINVMLALSNAGCNNMSKIALGGTKGDKQTAFRWISQLSNYSYKSINLNNMREWDDDLQNTFIQELITNPPNIDELSQEEMSSVTELRLKASKLTTPLEEFSAVNTNMNNSARATSNVLESKGIDADKFQIDNWNKLRWNKTDSGNSGYSLFFISGMYFLIFFMRLCINSYEKISNNEISFFSCCRRKHNMQNNAFSQDDPQSRSFYQQI